MYETDIFSDLVPPPPKAPITHPCYGHHTHAGPPVSLWGLPILWERIGRPPKYMQIVPIPWGHLTLTRVEMEHGGVGQPYLSGEGVIWSPSCPGLEPGF